MRPPAGLSFSWSLVVCTGSRSHYIISDKGSYRRCDARSGSHAAEMLDQVIVWISLRMLPKCGPHKHPHMLLKCVMHGLVHMLLKCGPIIVFNDLACCRNADQPTRVWNGLDQSAGFIFQSSPGGFGLDWIRLDQDLIHQLSGFWTGLASEMCHVYPIFRDMMQFLLIVTLTSEILPSNLQLYTFVFRLFLHVDFTKYLVDAYSVVSGPDWTGFSFWPLGHQMNWTGLGSVARGFGLDWIVSTQSIPYSAANHM